MEETVLTGASAFSVEGKQSVLHETEHGVPDFKWYTVAAPEPAAMANRLFPEGLPGMCSVCQTFPPKAGSLHCQHSFCHDCFKRYVNGSLDELNHYLRCCICGGKSHLTKEGHEEIAKLSFGRDGSSSVQLGDPIGLCVRSNGDFVTIDRARKRGFVFTRCGQVKEDFPYVHDAYPMDGLAVTKDDRVVAPFKSKGQDVLTYFLPNGDVMTSTFFNRSDGDIDITGVAVTSTDWIVSADCQNSMLNFVHPERRHLRSVPLVGGANEKEPEPRGIAVSPKGDLVVTDWANHCIRVLDSDGAFKFKFGERGERPGQFLEPYGVAVDGGGRIFVAEKANNRVQIFTPEGEFIRYLVRYKQGSDVYLAPFDLVCLPGQEVAVLLAGIRDATAAEIRIYPYVLDMY